jgi:HD superfamily phosphohydrolase
MSEEKAHEKIIRDAIHGFIHIENDYFKIIDTPNFQRLKRLEQTNARPLYPCAHHDRFSHSLGVYHLGKTAFGFLRKNSENDTNLNRGLDWETVKVNFEIACLLHDVGHAPFSHTFEVYYDEEQLNSTLKKINVSEDWDVERKSFFDDYILNDNAAPHEKLSVILILTEYFDILVAMDARINPFLIARMILGLTYTIEEKTLVIRKFNNCFISLLNSEYIDVDKLDYYARDQWATGNISRMLNFERLLSALYLKKHKEKYVICFHKRAIDDILALIEIKKMISVSMHSHHIVKYDEYVLKKAIEEVSEMIGGSESDKNIRKIISLASLNPGMANQVENFKFHLLTDDDLIHILKYYMYRSPYAREWFSRNYRLKAVWKTFADYKFFFKDWDDEKRKKFYDNREEIIEEFLKTQKYQDSTIKNDYYTVCPAGTEYNPILTPNIKIFIKGEVVELRDLRDAYDEEKEKNDKKKNEFYFLLYLPKNIIEEKRDEFITFVRTKVNESDKSDENICSETLQIAEETVNIKKWNIFSALKNLWKK